MIAVLEISTLTKAFGGVNAVKNVSFDLKDGELLALIGPNGAGKSTCFNIIMGQLLPDQGTVRFMGENLIGQATRDIWRKGVGRTFQITATYPSMTVIENVQIALLSFHNRLFSILTKSRNQYRDRAEGLLDLLGMISQADRPAAVLAVAVVQAPLPGNCHLGCTHQCNGTGKRRTAVLVIILD